ncbi:MAG: ribose 5-phosphate isomerase A [Desulfurococcaceae archaeon]
MSELEIEHGKILAAREACKLVEGLGVVKVLGLGTGSTVRKFIDTCLHLLRNTKLVASSSDTVLYAKSLGLNVLDLLSVNSVDVYIDGADEVSGKLDLVKGRGAALFREKTIAYLSQTRIYVVDYTKYTGLDYLYVKPIPIEVVPAALNYVLKTVSRMGLFEPLVRKCAGKEGPVITDNNNYLVDLKPLQPIVDPSRVHYELKRVHGVVESGIFPSGELVDVVVVGYADRACILRKDAGDVKSA